MTLSLPSHSNTQRSAFGENIEISSDRFNTTLTPNDGPLLETS